MRFSKARSQLLPIADPFEVEEFHGLACADEELAVVLDLHKRDALFAEPVLLLSGEKFGLGFGEVVEIKERVSLLGKGSVHLVFG